MEDKMLQKLIDESGYRKDYIAKRIGVCKSQISHWISGRRKPNKNNIEKLAIILNCSVEDLQ